MADRATRASAIGNLVLSPHDLDGSWAVTADIERERKFIQTLFFLVYPSTGRIARGRV